MPSKRALISIAVVVVVVVGCLLLLPHPSPTPMHTPLYDAVLLGDVAKVRRILAHGADVNQPAGRNGGTCLMVAVDNAGEAALVLRSKGLATTAADIEKRREALEIVRLLLSRRVEVDKPDRYGGRPLSRAATLDDEEVVRALIAAGADARKRDRDGGSLLFAAFEWPIHGSRAGVVDALAEAGLDVNARDGQGRTALHVLVAAGRSQASVAENIEGIKAMVAHGADVNARDVLGLRPVDYARFPEVAQALRDAAGKVRGE